MSGRRLPLYGMLAASSLSVAGTRVSALALPWLVLLETRSASLTGLVLLFEMTPYVVAKGLGGPVVDRLGPRRVSVVSDLLSGLATALVPVLFLAGQLGLPDRMPLLLAIVAVVGVVRGPGDGAKNALVPEVAEAAQVTVERVTGLDGTVDRTSSLVAAGAGGFLIAAVGPAAAILLDAASFLLCAGIIALTAPRRPVPPTAAGGHPSYLRELRAGAGFLRREPLLRSIVGMVAATNLLDAALSSVLLPVWATAHGYDTRHIGVIATAFGVTATLGSLAATAWAGRFSRRWAYLAGYTLAGAPRFVVLALGAPLWLVVAVHLVGGLGCGFINPVIGAVFFERTPRPLVGRVGGLADSLAWAGIPLGGVLGGAAVTVFGLAPALLVAGGLYLLATTAPGLRPEWREMDRRAPQAGWATGPDGTTPPDHRDDAGADQPAPARPGGAG